MSEEEGEFQSALYALSDYDEGTIQHANEAFFCVEENKWEEAVPYLELACQGRYGHSYYDLAIHLLGNNPVEEEKKRAASLLLKATIRNIDSPYNFGDLEHVLVRVGTDLRKNHTDLTIKFLWGEYDNTEFPEPIAAALQEVTRNIK